VSITHNHRTLLLATLCAGSLLVAGCSEEQPEPRNNVSETL